MPRVELKSSISIGSITEISPKGFTIGVKAENENILKILPLYGPDLSPRQKKDAYQLNLEGQFATLGPMLI
jgi:hypothetical protein